MSKVAITGNTSGTGTFTIAAPNSNTDRTLTLPDEAGTVLTDTGLPSELNASGSAPIYACRAWVNFDGTTNTGGNCDIRGSGNVSSVTDNGAGDYTVNFTTAMPDANYAVQVSSADGSVRQFIVSGNVATGSVRVRCQNSSGSNADTTIVCVSVFR